MVRFRIERKAKQPMEFSKKILVVSWLTGIFIIFFALWLSYMMIIKGHDGDVSIILTILGGAFAEITAGTSFYYWKAKKENEIKLSGIYNVEDDGE